MRKPSNRWLRCHCGRPLETVATTANPKARITAHSLARCPQCLFLVLITDDLRPGPTLDEAAFTAAMNASPEMHEWATKTLTESRIRAVSEIRQDVIIERERMIERRDPDLTDDLAALDAFLAGIGADGYVKVPIIIRRQVSGILERARRRETSS